ncbi:nuclear transport factor 2 family protein [Aureitalea marina]|uniref:SnoaL-like domain-containing protein n=1 Tax=Aureitalea marina TaxID=930804 RepID=A0A2S7KP68_9FLAO|nr:nuclear transport factor 2 family protein [Aureitalea marina]PQB04415.1 hypothetical protein BST85_05515 [Aureitalea marina]
MISFTSYGQNSPEAVVQAQLESYNRGDLDAFMATFDPQVIFTDASGEITMQGAEAVRERYKSYFEASPNLHSEIQTRIVQGDFVIDHEHITGRYGNPEIYELVLVFRVKLGKIVRVTVYGK